MRGLRQWLIRLTTSITRRHDDTRLREELDDHLAFETAANVRRGLPPADARRRALLTFGSVESFKENCRDQQGVPAVEHLLQDVRIALRRMSNTYSYKLDGDTLSLTPQRNQNGPFANPFSLRLVRVE